MVDRDYQNGERTPSRNEMETGKVTEYMRGEGGETEREREREKERRRARRKRILIGTAVIWRALCTTIVKRRAEKRKTCDDVRFHENILLYVSI